MRHAALGETSCQIDVEVTYMPFAKQILHEFGR